MSFATQGLAFLAGILSTLSPCVLPLLPIVIGTAASQHRFGPAALAGGLAMSFVAIGLDGSVFRRISAALLIVVGVVLISSHLQQALATATTPVAGWIGDRFGGGSGHGLWGQAGVGLLLGAVWSPCVGPTLGAASVLASQGESLIQVAATMLVFGLGAALPLLILGTMSREVMLKLRGTMLSTGSVAKSALGAVLLIVGVLILSGYDKSAEAALVEAMPEWLTALTTRY